MERGTRTPAMKGMVPNTLVVFIGLFLASVNVCAVMAQTASQQAQAAKPAKQVVEIRLGYLRAYAPQLALSVLDVPPRDEGVAGANVAIADNNTTGKFLGQKFYARRDRGEAGRRCRAGLQGDGRQGRPLRARRHFGQAIAVDRRHRPRQRRADLQCRRHRRHPARGGVPGERVPHRADAHDAGRRPGAVSDLEAVAALGADLRLA